jgi:metal-responsive CopG/Arc/MetJ family transcriptional regulator
MARMSISLEDDLLERIEDARGDVPRSVWVRHAVLAHCEDCESRSPMLRVLRGVIGGD